MHAQEALEDAHAAFHAAVRGALPHGRLDRGRALRQGLGDGVAQALQRRLAVGADEHAAAVAQLADAGDRAVDALVHVDALALEDPAAQRLGVAVAHHQHGHDVLLVVAAHVGVVELHLGDLPRTTLLPAVRGRVPPTLHALVAPRPERQVRGCVCIAVGLRRGARVPARPRGASLLGGVLRLVRLMHARGRLPHGRLVVIYLGRRRRRPDRVGIALIIVVGS